MKASDRKVRRFVRQWRKRYPRPRPWVDDRANRQCRRSEAQWFEQFEEAATLRRHQVVALIEWRLGNRPDERDRALQGIAGPGAWGHARRCVRKALDATNPNVALDCLVGECGGIPGWDPAMASVVLGACRPRSYPMAHERALRTLRALDLYAPSADHSFVRGDWWPYLRLCRQLTQVCDVSLREVAQALWAAADEAPKLPKAPKTTKTTKTTKTLKAPRPSPSGGPGNRPAAAPQATATMPSAAPVPKR